LIQVNAHKLARLDCLGLGIAICKLEVPSLSDPQFTTEPFDTKAWHPRVRGVYEYWRQLQQPSGRLPAHTAFDPLKLPEASGWMWLHDIHTPPLRLQCRRFGADLAALVGVDITGQWLDLRPLADPQRPLDAARLHKTAIEGRATWARMPPLLRHGDVWAEVESLMLPLAQDGERPDIMLGVSVYYRADGSAL
jgi:hypothetical protein